MRTTPEVIDAMRAHAEATYPEECCGFFLGRLAAAGNHVTGTLPVANTHDGRRERRFRIRPADYLAAESEAARRGLDVLGVYHSHPDHPARPSETDLKEATFPGLSYAIIPVTAGTAGAPTAWALAQDRSRFDPENIDTLP